jgi:hypothetical protein
MGQRPPLVADHAVERRHAHAAARIPRGNGEARRAQLREHRAAGGIVDAVEVEPRAVPLALAEPIPSRRRVALDDLGDGVADGLERMIARGEAVGARGEAAAACRLRQRVVGMHRLIGQPGRAAAEQVAALDPENGEMLVEPVAGRARQAGDVDDGVAVREVRAARQLERPIDPLGMKSLDGFHQARGRRRREVESLALGDRDGARVRSADHDHGNADAVEAGHIGDPGDAHRRHQRLHARHGLLRRHQPVRADAVSLAAAVAACNRAEPLRLIESRRHPQARRTVREPS